MLFLFAFLQDIQSNYVRDLLIFASIILIGLMIGSLLAVNTRKRTTHCRVPRYAGLGPILKPAQKSEEAPKFLLIVLDSPNPDLRNKEFGISRLPVIVGRADESSHIVIHDPSISRNHIRIFEDKGHIYIDNLSPENETLLNGKTVTRDRLRNEDEIEIGRNVRLQFLVIEPTNVEETDIEDRPKKNFFPYWVTFAYPKLFSKRYSSIILINLHTKITASKLRASITRQVKEFGQPEEAYITKNYPSLLEKGMFVKVKIESAEIEFSAPVVRRLIEPEISIIFTVKPSDSCNPHKTIAKLSICVQESDEELFSAPIDITVVDFVFDHVSRPFIYNLATAFSGLSALVMFILTLFGQIDTTFGLASGATASAVAIAVFIRFTSLFQHMQNVSSVP
jgi:pSer/pThr/pTyr-binding forkhead associated (FHA) protein